MDNIIPDDMQPIETAPKDGTPIILKRRGYGLYSAQWSNGAWTIRHTRDGAFLKLGNTVPEAEATHWKPA